MDVSCVRSNERSPHKSTGHSVRRVDRALRTREGPEQRNDPTAAGLSRALRMKYNRSPDRPI